MRIEIPEVAQGDVQPLWVYGPRADSKGLARVLITHQNPKFTIRERQDNIPHVFMSAAMCRRVAYLLNQAADLIDGKVLVEDKDGYERAA